MCMLYVCVRFWHTMEFIQMVYSHVTAPLCSKVTCKDEDDVSVSSDSLGEQLFDLVDVYNTGHSQKITGKQPVHPVTQQ